MGCQPGLEGEGTADCGKSNSTFKWSMFRKKQEVKVSILAETEDYTCLFLYPMCALNNPFSVWAVDKREDSLKLTHHALPLCA